MPMSGLWGGFIQCGKLEERRSASFGEIAHGEAGLEADSFFASLQKKIFKSKMN